MRAHLSLLGVSAVLLLGACDQAAATGSAAGGSAGATPSPVVHQPPPAAEAGGACRLIDYDVIDEALGVRFDVAASGKQGKTITCVVRSSEKSLPDLVFTVSPTTADTALFGSEVVPDGARTVKSLGKAAYRSTAKAAKGRGPAVEVGWLAKDKKLVTLRFTTAAGTPSIAAGWRGDGLVTLAKKIEQART